MSACWPPICPCRSSDRQWLTRFSDRAARSYSAKAMSAFLWPSKQLGSATVSWVSIPTSDA